MALTTLAYTAKTDGTGATITIPATRVAGDFCVIGYVGVSSIAGAPADGTPAGFTKLVTGFLDNPVGARINLFAKVLDGTETTVTGFSASAARWIAAIWRPDAPILAFANGMTPNHEVTTGTPATQTITGASAASLPFLMLGYMYSSSVGTPPTPNAVGMSQLSATNIQTLMHYLGFDTGNSPANQSYGMTDNGINGIVSTYLTFTSSESATLACATGAFTFSGIAALINKGKSLVCDGGAFLLSGVAAGTKAARKTVAETGSFLLTGIDAGLHAGKLLACAAGSFLLAGMTMVALIGQGIFAAGGSFLVSEGVQPLLTWVRGFMRTPETLHTPYGLSKVRRVLSRLTNNRGTKV